MKEIFATKDASLVRINNLLNVPQAIGNKWDKARLHENKDWEKIFTSIASRKNHIFSADLWNNRGREIWLLDKQNIKPKNGREQIAKYNYLYAAFERNLTSTVEISCQILSAYLAFFVGSPNKLFPFEKTLNFVEKKRVIYIYICKINQIDRILLYSACKLFFFSEKFSFDEKRRVCHKLKNRWWIRKYMNKIIY